MGFAFETADARRLVLEDRPDGAVILDTAGAVIAHLPPGAGEHLALLAEQLDGNAEMPPDMPSDRPDADGVVRRAVRRLSSTGVVEALVGPDGSATFVMLVETSLHTGLHHRSVSRIRLPRGLATTIGRCTTVVPHDLPGTFAAWNERLANPVVSGADDPLLARFEQRWTRGDPGLFEDLVRALVQTDPDLADRAGTLTLRFVGGGALRPVQSVGWSFEAYQRLAAKVARLEDRFRVVGFRRQAMEAAQEGLEAVHGFRARDHLAPPHILVTVPLGPSRQELVAARRLLKNHLGEA